MTIAIIPARMASTRFPGKPLAKIRGVPMLGHCYFRTKMSDSLEEVFIATCDEEIRQYALSIGAPCIMTADTHDRATDRIAEAMLKIEHETNVRHEIIVLVQGDEPMLHPEMIDVTVKALEMDPNLNVANGYAKIKTKEEFEDPNEVKVVIDSESYAMYFSREPIPSSKKWGGEVPMYKQVCIIPFRRDYLLEFNKLAQTSLEKIESIDMLRVLETGSQVKMVEFFHQSLSVDTIKDLSRVVKLMERDELVSAYIN